MNVYIDTSAAAKLLRAEAESEALREFCNTDDLTLTATDLLDTELHRFGRRHGLDPDDVDMVLDGITLYELDRAMFTQAGRLPDPHLRTLDALHVAGALRLGAEAMLAYDRRVLAAAQAVGLLTLSPSVGG